MTVDGIHTVASNGTRTVDFAGISCMIHHQLVLGFFSGDICLTESFAESSSPLCFQCEGNESFVRVH